PCRWQQELLLLRVESFEKEIDRRAEAVVIRMICKFVAAWVIRGPLLPELGEIFWADNHAEIHNLGWDMRTLEYFVITIERHVARWRGWCGFRYKCIEQLLGFLALLRSTDV